MAYNAFCYFFIFFIFLFFYFCIFLFFYFYFFFILPRHIGHGAQHPPPSDQGAHAIGTLDKVLTMKSVLKTMKIIFTCEKATLLWICCLTLTVSRGKVTRSAKQAALPAVSSCTPIPGMRGWTWAGGAWAEILGAFWTWSELDILTINFKFWPKNVLISDFSGGPCILEVLIRLTEMEHTFADSSFLLIKEYFKSVLFCDNIQSSWRSFPDLMESGNQGSTILISF